MRLRSLLGYVRITQNLPFLLGNYAYQPLPSKTSIRLLELIPSTEKNRLRCSLRTFELEDAPSFKALSYTWGRSETTIKRASTSARNAVTQCATHHRDARTDTSEVYSDVVGRTRRHTIICDGRLMKVTSNLRDALRMLANSINMPLMSKTPTYYWVDALCVDQKNVLERNSQVARMADVFRKASGVVVWLGREDEYTADALTVIQKVSAIPESEWSLVPYTSFYDTVASHLRYGPSLTFYNWLGFIVFINRTWFRRAWVVQEIALGNSPIVVCGTRVFSWEKMSRTLSFIKATKWYHHLHTDKLKHLSTLQRHPGIYKRVLQSKLSVGISPVYLDETRVSLSPPAGSDTMPETQKPPLRALLEKHRFSKSTDPRDKVYAFLGLANTNMAPFRMNPNAITPDYSRTVQEVYLETARVLLTSYRNLSLLSYVEDPSSRRISNLPSWVPDYSVTLDPYPLRFRGPGFWKASGDFWWNMNVFAMSDGLLEVHGYRVGYIDQVSVLSNESNDPSALWASIVKLALSLNLPYPNPSGRKQQPSRVEILWRTLTTNVYAHTYPAPSAVGCLFIDYILNLQIRHLLTPWSSTDEFQPHHSPLSESTYPEWRTLLELESPDSPYCLDKYRARLTKVVESMFNGTYSPIDLAQLQHEFDQSGGKKRRLFKTQCGYLGTGPRSLRQDDEVWILHRGGLPFVLRQQANGHYRLIGEAFVYGIMHGEVTSMVLQRRNITIE